MNTITAGALTFTLWWGGLEYNYLHETTKPWFMLAVACTASYAIHLLERSDAS